MPTGRWPGWLVEPGGLPLESLAGLLAQLIKSLDVRGAAGDRSRKVRERELVHGLVDDAVRLAGAGDEARRVVEALADQAPAQDGVAVLVGRSVKDRFGPEDAGSDPDRLD